MATRPTDVVKGIEKLSLPSTGGDTMQELRAKILAADGEAIGRLRKESQDLDKGPVHGSTESNTAEAAQASHTAQGLDTRLESLAAWVKNMEQMVHEARTALAQGREPVLPTLGVSGVFPGPTPGPASSVPISTAEEAQSPPAKPTENAFGVTPARALPPHLRTESTQVEPATPPKWALATVSQGLEEEFERARSEEHVSVGEMMVEGRAVAGSEKGERVHVATVFQKTVLEKVVSRSHTPDPTHIPLKPPAQHMLRSAPSTPMLRSSGLSSLISSKAHKNLSRRSESNLRAFASTSTSTTPQISPRRATYEERLSSQPHVVRQGEGWSSSVGRGSGRPMAKTSSMASLRERALAFLRDEGKRADREIVDLAHAGQPGQAGSGLESRRGSVAALGLGRPGTPGQGREDKKAGFWGRLMRKGGGAKREEA